MFSGCGFYGIKAYAGRKRLLWFLSWSQERNTEKDQGSSLGRVLFKENAGKESRDDNTPRPLVKGQGRGQRREMKTVTPARYHCHQQHADRKP
jgi:hypothetical protein